jgi:glycosyltransferase involved in cell wall biosynthesis
MKICLVTAFPPSRGGLSEYGFHIARELQQNPLLSVSVLGDKVPLTQADDPSVIRCWSFNDIKSPGHILKAIRKMNPDVVWFNLLFTTFGHNPLIAFYGLTLPLLTRLNGFYTHVTLHHLMDTLDLEDAGVRFPALYRTAGAAATKILLRSNSISVLMPAYRNILLQKYGGENVHFRTHGILSRNPEYPDFSRRGNPIHRILAFGKWGTYKRVEPLIEVFKLLTARYSNVKLVIAGGDHPRAPGYIASMARRFESPRIEFTGYVPEEKIPDLFRSASIVAMPYSSSTGASGVAHIACAYGVPLISADIPDFRHMADEEGMAIEFYKAGDTQDLADKLANFLDSPDRQRTMAKHNFSAALRMTMPKVIHEYVRQFDIAQQTRALRPIRRFRRLPPWLSRSFVGRAILRNLPLRTHRRSFSQSWIDSTNRIELLDVDGRSRRNIPIARTAGNGNGVTGTGTNGGGRTSAGGQVNSHSHHGKNQESLDQLFPVHLADQNKSTHPEGERGGVEEAIPLHLPMVEESGSGNSGNGKSGVHGLGTEGNSGRGESTGHSNGETRTGKSDWNA